MKKQVTVLLICAVFFLVHVRIATAVRIQGEGFGNNLKEAKKAALSDLSFAIQVEVMSSHKSVFSESNSEEYKYVEEILHVKSSLPLLGASFTDFRQNNRIEVIATLESERSLPLYKGCIKDINEELKEYAGRIEKGLSKEIEYSVLLKMLSLIEKYYKYRIVTLMLGASEISSAPVTEAEIRTRLSEHEIQVMTIDFAAYKITKGIQETRIFVFPPTTRYSHEITQFASAVRDALATHLKTVRSPDKADYFMTGEYKKLRNGIEITYRLVDQNADVLRTSVVVLDPQGYTGYEIEPKSINFDRLLYNGYVVTSDFRAEISTNKGKRDIMYKKGEVAELLVKMNNPGYFYIIGHVLKENRKYSYLLQFREDKGERKFIYYINADDSNKWISLGDFDVVKPFGVESLQLIASSKDPINNIPKHKYDENTELYILYESPEENLVRTRALKKKVGNEVKSSESVLMFTTFEQ